MGLIKNLKSFSLSQEPDPWVYKLGGGSISKTGVTVNEETAMKFSAVFACIRVLSETLASVPIIVYKDRAPGIKNSGKDRAVDHPLYDLLHNAPNDEMPAYTFKETMMGHTTSSGNCYAQIIRNRRGNPIILNPLPWTAVSPERNNDTGKIEYKTNDRGKSIVLNADEVFHIPGIGFDGIKGYSPIRMAMEAIGLGLAAEAFGANFFANGASVSGIAEYPGKLSDEAYERFKEDVTTTYTGLGNAKKVMFLEEGLKFHQVTIPPNEAQFLETRRFQKEEIASIYRVPLHLIQDLSKSTNNNIEHQSLEFVMYTMLPWFTRWEQFINFKLFSREERRKGYFAEFLINTLLRGDSKARAEMLHLMRQDGVLSADEWRELENMNPQEGSTGKLYFINGNMISTEIAAKQQPKNVKGGEE